MRVVVVTAALALAVSCSGGDSSSKSKGAKGDPGAGQPAPSPRDGLQSWRPLLGEVTRAELTAGGLAIDFGTGDERKYTNGGWETGWGDNDDKGGATYTELPTRKGKLFAYLTQPAVHAIALRARSPQAPQTVEVTLGGASGKAELGTDWTEVRIPLSEPVKAPGRTAIELSLSAGEAEIDWLFAAATPDATAPPLDARMEPMAIGGRTQRSLAAPSPRTYSFYLEVPDRSPALVTAIGSDAGATFSVHAQADGGEAKRLFREAGGAAWTEHRIDLAPYAGRVIRLDLRTEGGAGGWGEPAIMVAPGPKPAPPAASRTDKAIVILIDTARADAFGVLDPNKQVKTPAYDALLPSSAVFRASYNNENWTKPSVATLLSGTYPDSHSTRYRDSVLPDDVHLLPEHLQDHGFATGAVISNRVVSSQFGFDQGWTDFLRGGNAEETYAEALKWLETHKDDKFFLYVHTIDPHAPYDVAASYAQPYYQGSYTGGLGSSFETDEQTRLNGKPIPENDLAWIKALYNGEITYHDEHMGKFLDAVAKLGLLDKAVLVITNDHGEELAEHGGLGHGWTLYDEQLHSQLLFRRPGAIPPGELGEVVEHVDVAPTLAQLLGVPPLPHGEGESLLPLMHGAPIRPRPFYAISWARGTHQARTVRVGRWKLIAGGGDWPALYDLEADPGELTDLLGERPIARRMCEVYLGEGLGSPSKATRFQGAVRRRQIQASRAKLDAKTRRELEALGYFGGDGPPEGEPDAQQ